MSANYGFVYVLRNVCMPGVYKIGMTDRAPSQRAEELSSSTSTPVPFEVVCFAEVKDARSAELHMHNILSERRISTSREFFALTGDDFSQVFDVLDELSGVVAYGDISFLDDQRVFGPIGRARSALTSSTPSARMIRSRGV